jgi:hypothetical protein
MVLIVGKDDFGLLVGERRRSMSNITSSKSDAVPWTQSFMCDGKLPRRRIICFLHSQLTSQLVDICFYQWDFNCDLMLLLGIITVR